LEKCNNLRLFLALWPPAPVHAALVQHQRDWSWPAGAARVAPERLHITLHFLGAVAGERLEALRPALAVPFEPFVLSLQEARARVWPGGLAVLEMDAPPALERLHARLGRAVEALGLPVETRSFRPHVTLARKAAGARPAPSPPAPTWHARDGYALVRSTPGRGYDTLNTYGPA
jgi:2'-5' RNA ligase